MKRFLFIIAILLAMYPVKGQQNIVAGEYFIDADPGTGNGTPVSVVSPSTDVTVTQGLSVSSLSAGYHQISFRFIDALGHWGLTYTRSFYVQAPTATIPNIISGEYFIDQDPGIGLATSVAVVSPSTNVTLNLALPVSNLSSGQHSLVYRFLDNAGRWSQGSSQLFYVQAAPVAASNITYGEYFFDTDPGFGNADNIILTPGTNVTANFSIPADSIPYGFHNLVTRFKDQTGKWSFMESNMFVKLKTDAISTISRGEYFFDIDPGVGNGTAINVSNPSTNISFSPTVSTGGLAANNFHILHYRFQTLDGKWGESSGLPFYISDNKEKYYTPINKLEFHLDNNKDSARLRIDSVGLVMNGYTVSGGSIILQPEDSVDKIGRHFVYTRGIDYFGHYGKYSQKEFVVTNDLTKGMLLGQSLNPDSTIMTGGIVEIYKDSNGVISLFDSIPVDNTGNFLIGGILPGTYLFLLRPNLIASPTAINTYYDQQPQWQMANFQNINSDTMFADATIKALKTKDLNGLTSLSGFISASSKKSRGISISPEKSTGRPMKGASVVLVGKSTKGVNPLPSNVIASTTTDDSGYYSFANVPKGDYDIIIDILGVPLINHYSISVDSTATYKSNLNYIVGTAGIQVLSVSLPKVNNILLYPNPSSGEINLLFGNERGTTNISIYDLSGKLVYGNNLEVIANSVYTLDLHSVGKGLYNILIRNGNMLEVKKLIIQ